MTKLDMPPKFFQSSPPTYDNGSIFLGYKVPGSQTFTSFSPSSDINAYLQAITGLSGYQQRQLLQSPNGTEVLNLPFRELYAVFPLSSKRLFIDSFAQHVAAALDLPSTVCWIANKPEVFGYDMHTNILPNANVQNHFNKFSYLDQFDISGQIQQFPYDTVNLFDVNQIVKAVQEQK